MVVALAQCGERDAARAQFLTLKMDFEGTAPYKEAAAELARLGVDTG